MYGTDNNEIPHKEFVTEEMWEQRHDWNDLLDKQDVKRAEQQRLEKDLNSTLLVMSKALGYKEEKVKMTKKEKVMSVPWRLYEIGIHVLAIAVMLGRRFAVRRGWMEH